MSERVTNLELQKQVEQLVELAEGQNEKIKKQELQIQELIDSKKMPAKSNEPYQYHDRPPEGGGWRIDTSNRELFGKFAKTRFAGGIGVVMPDEPEADERVRSMTNYDGYVVTVVGPEELLEAYKEMNSAKPPKEEMYETLRSN